MMAIARLIVVVLFSAASGLSSSAMAAEPLPKQYPSHYEPGPWCRDLIVGPGMNAAGRNLRNSRFIYLDLSGANFDDADLTNAEFSHCTLNGATFRRARLENTEFSHIAPLPTDVDVTDAVINGIRVFYTAVDLFSYEQFISTYSYKHKQLAKVPINCGGRYPGEPTYKYDLRRADLHGARLAGECGQCDLTDASIWDLRCHDLRIDAAQLASTRDFKEKSLRGIDFDSITLRGKLDLKGMKLERVNFGRGAVAASFDNVRLVACTFDRNVTREQLLVTSNFRSGDLSGLTFRHGNFDGLDLSRFDLSGCYFDDCSWRDTKLADAVVTDVTLSSYGSDSPPLWTNAQLHSTWNYRNDRLVGIQFRDNNPAEPWDFSGRSLTNVVFDGGFSDLNFERAKLTNVWVNGGFSRANFRGAVINGLSFGYEAGLDADFRGAKLIRADFRELMSGVGNMLDDAELIDVLGAEKPAKP